MATEKEQKARRIALDHIRDDVERGFSKHSIQLSRRIHIAAGTHVSIGLDQRHMGGKDFPTTKVVVSQMDGEDCLYVFSLHKLYMEIKQEDQGLLV